MPAVPTTAVRQRARRRQGLDALTDIEVWSYNDDEIINASLGAWRSSVYKHYDSYLDRIYDEHGSPSRLVFRFECKYKHPSHSVQFRDRMRTGDGTRNLRTTAQTCDARWGVTQSLAPQSHYFSSYSEARHRVLIALRCAQNKRSFNSVDDDLYKQEVHLLRPGTILPSSRTVSRDTQVLYACSSDGVKSYYQKLPGAIHFAIDGWTSPQASSFLGLVAIWRDEGKIWRSILEFVHLTHAHTGDYLASRVAECLKRYGIEQKVLSICLDNASNNNTLTDALSVLIRSFRGAKNRVRCLAHIINLMAKAFLSLFSKPPRRKKASAPASQPRADASSETPTQHVSHAENEDEDDTDGVLRPETDPDKQEYDDHVVQKIVQKALDQMAKEEVVPTKEQIKEGQTIIPKVAGLVRRVHASTHLRERFEQLATKNTSSEQRILTKRVDTRWDTEYDCLESHIHFKVEAQLLTGDSSLKLKSYSLNEAQYSLADEMLAVLEIFKERTKRFSLAEVPLLPYTLPELALMRSELEAVCIDSVDMSPLTRVAARAATLVYDKYIKKMTAESEMYYMAVAMCPSLKLKWFLDNSYLYNDIQKIREMVIERFYQSYTTALVEQSVDSKPTIQQDNPYPTKRVNKYLHRQALLSAAPASPELDSIERYLADDVVPESVIAEHGGLVKYCTDRLVHFPRVFTMALDYITAPASSVDAERAFSNG
ncbi:AC transposase [Ceratobasidium sp. AG-Ba]|nr:AC transposase [Ceratobasidium sp. AG-Ba]